MGGDLVRPAATVHGSAPDRRFWAPIPSDSEEYADLCPSRRSGRSCANDWVAESFGAESDGRLDKDRVRDLCGNWRRIERDRADKAYPCYLCGSDADGGSGGGFSGGRSQVQAGIQSEGVSGKGV